MTLNSADGRLFFRDFTTSSPALQLPVDPHLQQEPKKSVGMKSGLPFSKNMWQFCKGHNSLWSKPGGPTEVPDETIGLSVFWKGRFCEYVLACLSGTLLPCCSSCLPASRGTKLGILLVPRRKCCNHIIPRLLEDQSELQPLLSHDKLLKCKEGSRWQTA